MLTLVAAAWLLHGLSLDTTVVTWLYQKFSKILARMYPVSNG